MSARCTDPHLDFGFYDTPLHRVFTDATSSDATASDLDGAGRIIGNLITRGGRHIVSLCTSLSLLLGGGPTEPLRTILESLKCSFCAQTYFGGKATLPRGDAPIDFVLRELFIRSRSCAFCGATRGFSAASEKISSKTFKAFVGILRGRNHSSQYAAILYIVAITSLLPDIPAISMKHDIIHALAVLRSRVEQRPDKNLDFLLAPSHRALAMLGELEIHSIAKEVVTLTDRVSAAETWESSKELIHQRTLFYRMLTPFWNSAHSTICIAVIIRAGIGDDWDFASVAQDKWPIDAFIEGHLTDPLQLNYGDLAKYLACAKDTVLNSMLTALLLAMKDNLIAFYCLGIQYDIWKGRTPHNAPRTVNILQSIDGERLLRSHLGLIASDDKDFMHYALWPWHDYYWDDVDTKKSIFSDAEDDIEGEEWMYT